VNAVKKEKGGEVPKEEWPKISTQVNGARGKKKGRAQPAWGRHKPGGSWKRKSHVLGPSKCLKGRRTNATPDMAKEKEHREKKTAGSTETK